MDVFRIESVRLATPREKAFQYIAAPENLPEWTHAFKEIHDGKAVLATPAGTVEVGLRVDASEPEGTIDWHMKFPSGPVASAFSRVVRESSEHCIFSFVLLAPPVPLEQLEGALNEQAQILRQELARLAAILGNWSRDLGS